MLLKKNIFFTKWQLCELRHFFGLVLNELIHEKTCVLHILLPLYSDIIFSIVHYCAGVSNKHCLLPFFISLYDEVDNKLVSNEHELEGFEDIFGLECTKS